MRTPPNDPEVSRQPAFVALTPHSDRGLRGLGDLIARVTSFLGIKPCEPCTRRAEALNSMVPFEKYEQESETHQQGGPPHVRPVADP
jgi:hypothetical protein